MAHALSTLSNLTPVALATDKKKEEPKKAVQYNHSFELPSGKIFQRVDGKLGLAPGLKSTLWKVAAVLSILVCAALVAGAVYAALYIAPVVALPLYAKAAVGAVGAAGLAFAAFKAYTSAMNHSKRNSEDARISAGICAEFAKIKDKKLDELGIHAQTTAKGPSAKEEGKWRHLVARENFWKGEREKTEKALNEKVMLLAKANADDKKPLSVKEIQKHGTERFELETTLCRIALQMEYLTAIKETPTCLKKLSDVGSENAIPMRERKVHLLAGIKTANSFFIFKDKDVEPLKRTPRSWYGVTRTLTAQFAKA
jgi:hypothetical protein